jgi:hypothetical protein
MESGKFYAYYSPSPLNTDHNLAGMEINTSLLQVYEGLCKEEYSVKSEKADEILEANRGKFVKMDYAAKMFTEVFNKKGDVTFVANPNMDQFKKRLSEGGEGEKPMLLIHINDKVFLSVFQ